VQDLTFNYFTAGLGGSGDVNLYITNVGFGEVRHSVLQCVAVCCSVLQYVCGVNFYITNVGFEEVRHSVLQCVAVCCSVL